MSAPDCIYCKFELTKTDLEDVLYCTNCEIKFFKCPTCDQYTPDDPKEEILTCQNDDCGEEFERPTGVEKPVADEATFAQYHHHGLPRDARNK